MNSFRALWPPIRAIWRILAGQNRRGRIANRWARLVILGVVFGVVVPLIIWPFVLLVAALTGSAGIVSAVAFLPLVSLPIFVIVLAAAYPLLSGMLVIIPGIRVLFGWLIVAIFGELVIGLYLAVVPVWNNPGLIPVLALFVVVLGMFLVLRRQFVGLQGRWSGRFATALVLAITVITLSFFFGGKAVEREEGAAPAAGISQVQAVPAAPSVEEFTLDAGEEKLTIFVGSGTFHHVQADKPWLAVVRAVGKEFQMPAGASSWQGGAPEGLLRVKGVENSTTLRFERVR